VCLGREQYYQQSPPIQENQSFQCTSLHIYSIVLENCPRTDALDVNDSPTQCHLTSKIHYTVWSTFTIHIYQVLQGIYNNYNNYNYYNHNIDLTEPTYVVQQRSPNYLIGLWQPRHEWQYRLSVSITTDGVKALASAKCNSVRKPYSNLPDTLVALASVFKDFQVLPAPAGALQSALRLCKNILTCSWKHLKWWRCIQNATRFD